MNQMTRCVLCALLAAACGGDVGGGNEPPPDGSDDVVCGDGTCTEGQEDLSTCPDDCIASPNCGDGACGSDESCGLCPADCGACAPVCGDSTCSGDETCTSCMDDCGCGEGQVCREDACAPISTNPLIASMPGSWQVVEVNGQPVDGDVVVVTVDPTQLTCDDPDQATPGDACVLGFPGAHMVLASTRLFLDVPGFVIEGQVLNDGTRVDYTLELEGNRVVADKLP